MKNNRRSGFTIVELLVAMSLFAVVASVATGAFIRALRTQRQLVAFAAANSNVSLVLEQMAREIRVGTDFTGSETSLAFTNARGQHVTYAYQDAATQGDSFTDHRVGAITRTVDGSGTQQLTADNVDVRDLKFTLRFADPSDGYPARVTTEVAVSPLETGVDTSVIRIQTTVSARNLGT